MGSLSAENNLRRADFRAACVPIARGMAALPYLEQHHRDRAPKTTQDPRGPCVLSSGVDEDRTHNLLDATEALSQLSYHPAGGAKV